MANYLDLNGTTDVVNRLKGRINEKASNEDVQLIVDELALKADKADIKVYESKHPSEVTDENAIILNVVGSSYDLYNADNWRLITVPNAEQTFGYHFGVRVSDITEEEKEIGRLLPNEGSGYVSLLVSRDGDMVTFKGRPSDTNVGYCDKTLFIYSKNSIERINLASYMSEQSATVNISDDFIIAFAIANEYTSGKLITNGLYASTYGQKTILIKNDRKIVDNFITNVQPYVDSIIFNFVNGETTNANFKRVNGEFILGDGNIQTGAPNYVVDKGITEIPNGKGVAIDITANKVYLDIPMYNSHTVTAEEASKKWGCDFNNQQNLFLNNWFCGFQNFDGYISVYGNDGVLTMYNATTDEPTTYVEDGNYYIKLIEGVSITNNNDWNPFFYEEGESIEGLNYVKDSTPHKIALEDNLKTVNGQSIVGEGNIQIESYKFPNVTIFGAPQISNGQMSNFTATNYAQFPFLVDFHGRTFEINMCFTTGANVADQQNIIDSVFGLAMAVRNGKFVIAMGSNGTTWNLGEHVGSYDVQPNTTYYLKFTWDGSAYELLYSTDKETYSVDIHTNETSTLFPRQIVIGKGADNTHIFGGSINLNYCNLLIQGHEVWEGMDDVGLATRLATDLSNIDDAGVEKVNEIVRLKTINGESIKGDGNIVIQGGGGEPDAYIKDAVLSSAKDRITFTKKDGTTVEFNKTDRLALSGGTLKGHLQLGDGNETAFKKVEAIRNIDGTPNGAAFYVNSDGTAAFFHKTYSSTALAGPVNDAILRFDHNGLSFAKGADSRTSATEYKKVMTEEDTYSKAEIDAMLGTINNALAALING